MTDESLKQLVAAGETATVELKLNAPRPSDLAERMCGMANTRTGGTVIFGIEDATHALLGVAHASETIDVILRAARMVRPPIPLSSASIREWLLNGRLIITVDIPASDGTLYQYNGACLVRRGTVTVPLSIDEISAHLSACGPTHWESRPCRNTTVKDLDTRAIERYLSYRAQRSRHPHRVTASVDLLLGLQVVSKDAQTGEVRPTNAGILLFGVDPQVPLPHSEVVCMKFTNTLGGRRYEDRQLVTGTIPELVDQVTGFLTRYVQRRASLHGFRHEEGPEYPVEAVREAVVNAVVHRDYSRVGETVRVFMYPDRVEVRSPGCLLPGIPLGDLIAMRVMSVPRNPLVAGFLRDMPGYMERVGSGIRFMVSEMEAMGLPGPAFAEHQDFVVTFRNGIAADDAIELNNRQQVGLRFVAQHGSICTSEYCAVTGAAERTAFRDLQDLVLKALLVARGKKRGQRYFLP